jgi:Beta-lactamase
MEVAARGSRSEKEPRVAPRENNHDTAALADAYVWAGLWIPPAGADLLPTIYRERGITPGDYYYGTQGRAGYGPQAKNLSEMIAHLAELPLAADPGTVYQYSVGYDVMGIIIERISGKSLEAYFRTDFRTLEDDLERVPGATRSGRAPHDQLRSVGRWFDRD